ncbi:MAG: Tryptophan/tyrosine permease [uncultured bacterium]|nr:MAG: Tryptophan/tyrosine permease [uncultured bacterium]
MLPPLLIVVINPHIFIAALAYAGIYCIILLIIFPVLMVWRGRYHQNIVAEYQVFGGKVLLVGLLIGSVLIIGQSIISMAITA